MVVTPTEHHQAHAICWCGHRVLMEKPLTGTLAGDPLRAELTAITRAR
jgi:hypothetical protein